MKPYTVTMQLLSSPDTPNRNGLIYTKESFNKALEKVYDLPLILITARPISYNKYDYLQIFDTSNLIGVARNVKCHEDKTTIDVTFTNDNVIEHLQKTSIDNYAIGMSYLASFNKDKTLEIDRILTFDLYNKDWHPIHLINNKVVE